MAYGDHDLLDAFKTFHGDSSMDDDTMQVLADDWFVRKATPYERRSTLLTLKKTLEEEEGYLKLQSAPARPASANVSEAFDLRAESAAARKVTCHLKTSSKGPGRPSRSNNGMPEREGSQPGYQSSSPGSNSHLTYSRASIGFLSGAQSSKCGDYRPSLRPWLHSCWSKMRSAYRRSRLFQS
jgi:hypothetical protein